MEKVWLQSTKPQLPILTPHESLTKIAGKMMTQVWIILMRISSVNNYCFLSKMRLCRIINCEMKELPTEVLSICQSIKPRFPNHGLANSFHFRKNLLERYDCACSKALTSFPDNDAPVISLISKALMTAFPP